MAARQGGTGSCVPNIALKHGIRKSCARQAVDDGDVFSVLAVQLPPLALQELLRGLGGLNVTFLHLSSRRYNPKLISTWQSHRESDSIGWS